MAAKQAGPSFRYERKFTVWKNLDASTYAQVRELIRCHPSMFFEPYPPRWVNNFYLDTPDMQNYFDNIQGATRRQKVRLRWYGNFLGEIRTPVLELKTKHGLVGTKDQYPFSSFDLTEGFSQAGFDSLAFSSDLPSPVRHLLRDQNLVLMNRYWRRYYATRDGRFRLTLDSELTYYRVNRLYNNFTHRQVDKNNLVVELKYDPIHDPQADKVAGGLPFRLARNSKYTQGIERVFF